MEEDSLFKRANELLQQMVGKQAAFRDGQYEAIEATMNHRRTLVVQRTGWGKSLVYFICTKLLRERGAGVTLVISPLLVLMQNQKEAAQKLHLSAETLNGQTENRSEIFSRMIGNTVDLVLITPETLFSKDVQSNLPKIKIGLFVIDEAHCISDWGHDFRMEYCRMREVVRILPPNVPVLATTATANDRVIRDLERQLGGEVYLSRGPLARKSLAIQVLSLPSRKERYAWILENIRYLCGSGIIYCLTQRDCDYLTRFLVSHHISALSYYSRSGQEEELNRKAEEAFRENRIKVLVATVKLGMGYDKGDIAFVIHFQMPSSIVAYYQQIGRAGRNIPWAYVVLMCGEEDERILEYFIYTAFPDERDMRRVLFSIEKNPGANVENLLAQINMSQSRVEKTLTFLYNEGYIFRESGRYYISPKPFEYHGAHYQSVIQMRRREMAQMKELVRTKICYSRFITQALDDKTACDCGRCSNCLKQELISSRISEESMREAELFLEKLEITIVPRKRWALSDVTLCRKIRYINEEGKCLSKYGDSGYGQLVKRDKYSEKERFCDELVGKSASLLKPWIQENRITHVTSVPSLRSNLVPDFAQRLAERCGLPYVELLQKKPAGQQKTMENSAHQCANAYKSFSVIAGRTMPKRVLLVDDMVDSGWTLTVCGYRLMEQGCEAVYPFALADSSRRKG